MEEGGFTVIAPTSKNTKQTLDEPINPYNLSSGNNNDTGVKRKKKEHFKSDFYKFQQKGLKRDNLLDLKKGFEKDLMKLQ
jgi:hypothetical protein